MTTTIPWTHIEGCDACHADECAFRVETDGTTVRACELDAFTRAYLECALWSSTGDDDQPLDDDHSTDDIAPEALQSAIDDCRSFQADNADDLDGLDAEKSGHDFWLTRNGHGAGFWDRGLGALGDRLSKASKFYGSCDLYVVDGKVYGF
jgi:hypothetical protein